MIKTNALNTHNPNNYSHTSILGDNGSAANDLSRTYSVYATHTATQANQGNDFQSSNLNNRITPDPSEGPRNSGVTDGILRRDIEDNENPEGDEEYEQRMCSYIDKFTNPESSSLAWDFLKDFAKMLFVIAIVAGIAALALFLI